MKFSTIVALDKGVYFKDNEIIDLFPVTGNDFLKKNKIKR